MKAKTIKRRLALPRQDRRGRRLSVGDIVRVVGIPDLRGELLIRESLPVFRHMLGTYRRIRAFNEYGLAEIHLRILRGRPRGIHAVWLEPTLLRLPSRQGRLR